jgi:hypothetical protein
VLIVSLGSPTHKTCKTGQKKKKVKDYSKNATTCLVADHYGQPIRSSHFFLLQDLVE